MAKQVRARFGVISLFSIALALQACGGGGGGLVSTPNPTPAPTPTPTPTNSNLINLVASQDFTNDAVTSSAVLSAANNQTISTSEGPTTITFHYDAQSRTYTVTGHGESESFSPSDRTTAPVDGQIDWQKTQPGAQDYLTILDPNSSVNGGITYVGAGYWQRNTTSSDGSQNIISFDAFTYGLETADADVPRTGTASYSVDLFGFFAPLNVAPRAITGSGTFSADFGAGAFATSGSAYEVDLADAYYTGTHEWRGAGLIGSGNGFSGNFTYDGRDLFSVSGGMQGRFYGPNGEELGAVFNATDAGGTLASGTLVGRKSGGALASPLTVLPDNTDRTYYSTQDSVLYIQRMGEAGVEGASTFIPGANGKVEFMADGGIVATTDPANSTSPVPSFKATDRIAAESDTQYTVYRTSNGEDSDQLTLYNPGAGNKELALTYASFGRWDFAKQETGRVDRGSVWFAYGVPTTPGTLARTGSAHYDAILHGSGIRFADAAKYDVSGSAKLDIDFNAMQYSGTLNAQATSSTAPTIDFGPYSFGDALANTYAFSTYLMDTPGHAEGSFRGRLYGPNGEEFAGSFEIQPHDASGFATGEFAGVAIGKRR